MAFSHLRLIDHRDAIGTLLFTLILSGFSAPRCGATVYQSNGSEANIQSIHNNQARDGDTIVVPAGTFSWTSRLNITKGITLQGATTIVGPSSSPVVIDATIIQDNTPRSGPSTGIIRAIMSPSQSFRLTGLTFQAGSSTTYADGNGAIHLLSQGNWPNTSMRVDHCHFKWLYQSKNIWVSGWVYGVADHNVLDCRNTISFYFWHETYGGPSQINGNGSWADYPWYGTNKFFFVEDNRINGGGTSVLSGNTDSFNGARFVLRHNYWQNAQPNSHGTEGGLGRGQRAWEVYDNTFNWTVANPAAGQRSGTSLWHDNVYLGIEQGNRHHTNLPVFRQTPARPSPVWGISDGTSIWDQNDTEGNGTYVEAHAHTPYVFDSGTHTGANGSQGLIVDSSKNWIPNRWAGYSIKNTNPSAPAYTLGSYIISNTSNTITYYYYSASDAAIHLIFNTGDSYQIHRVLTTMDQCGRGKSDRVTGLSQPINTVTGTAFWPHQALEPCMSWNNVHTPTGDALGYNDNGVTYQEGRDYHNLGAGFFPADFTPAVVSSIYTAARNGVAYTGTFVYPHPLVTAQPAQPTPTLSAACSLLQQRLDRLERRHQRLKRLHIPHRKLKRRLQRVQLQLQLQNCL
jgi:hypothetical protein